LDRKELRGRAASSEEAPCAPTKFMVGAAVADCARSATAAPDKSVAPSAAAKAAGAIRRVRIIDVAVGIDSRRLLSGDMKPRADAGAAAGRPVPDQVRSGWRTLYRKTLTLQSSLFVMDRDHDLPMRNHG
jgi:hypothetical protein